MKGRHTGKQVGGSGLGVLIVALIMLGFVLLVVYVLAVR